MSIQENILLNIKSEVHKIIPDAQVHLFGSRADGTFTDESDWDILVLTKLKHPKTVKWQIYDQLFPLSIQYSAFINFMLVQEDEWKNNPGYYSLRKNIADSIIKA
jgi:DNA polymerase sigma